MIITDYGKNQLELIQPSNTSYPYHRFIAYFVYILLNIPLAV